ncbi:Unknown protein sequence [Pseudomonas savastanoi pv. phaseolicola]|nr:Unknown protein sequence [Pseudomonas savastanoi pv. phaseolicola]KPB73285.1 Unknown protein sequence [Pseudomonas amygdali pv. mellea]
MHCVAINLNDHDVSGLDDYKVRFYTLVLSAASDENWQRSKGNPH